MKTENEIEQKDLSITQKTEDKIYICESCGWTGKLEEAPMGYCPNPKCLRDSLVIKTTETTE